MSPYSYGVIHGSSPRLVLDGVIEAFIEPVTEQALKVRHSAELNLPVPGRWGVRYNHYTTDLMLVVEIETVRQGAREIRRFRKRRVHAFARSYVKNRRHFIVERGRKIWIAEGHFHFLSALAKSPVKALTYEQA